MSKIKLTDDDIMPFGYYNRLDTKMANVPAGYLLWVKNNVKGKNENEKAVLLYIKENWSAIKLELSKDENR